MRQKWITFWYSISSESFATDQGQQIIKNFIDIVKERGKYDDLNITQPNSKSCNTLTT